MLERHVAESVLILSTLATAAFSAVVGMGGGITLLAVMATLMPASMVVPLHGLVQLTSNGTRTFLFLKHVHWGIFAYYMVPAVVGVAIGARLYVGSELPWFKPAVGAFILVYLATLRREPRLARMPIYTFAAVGFVAGSLSALIGATGPLIAPFFVRDDLDKEQVIATKAAVQITTHLTKLPAFVLLGFDYMAHIGIVAPLLVAAVLGTVVGKRYLSRLSSETFRKLFTTTLAAIAVYLLVTPLM
jgi:uncharacterized membrane protein YfcA